MVVGNPLRIATVSRAVGLREIDLDFGSRDFARQHQLSESHEANVACSERIFGCTHIVEVDIAVLKGEALRDVEVEAASNDLIHHIISSSSSQVVATPSAKVSMLF